MNYYKPLCFFFILRLIGGKRVKDKDLSPSEKGELYLKSTFVERATLFNKFKFFEKIFRIIKKNLSEKNQIVVIRISLV